MSQMTFYPSVDGFASDSTENQTWAAKRAAGGTGSNDVGISGTLCYIGASTFDSLWNSLHRALLVFNTSALPNNADISDAYIEVYIYGKSLTLSISPKIGLYSSSPVSNSSLAPGDFDSVGSTLLSYSRSYADIGVGSYNRFNFNSSGLAAISKTGYSKFSFRETVYDAEGSSPTWTSGQYLRVLYRPTEYGASYKPRLIVIYTAPSVYYEEVSDGIELGDAPSNDIESDEAVSDGIELGDSAVAGAEYPRTATDGIELGDSAVSQLFSEEELVDGIELGDSVEYDVGGDVFEESVTDGILLSDHSGVDYDEEVTDGILIGDSTSISGELYYIEVRDRILISDEPIFYRGPDVVRNLLDVRQKFCELSGREDLAYTTHREYDMDNGADFFIRAGSRYLDRQQPTHKEFTWYGEEITSGTYELKFKNCRTVKGVFYLNSDDELIELNKKALDELIKSYPEIGGTDEGTPADYSLVPQIRPPEQLDEGEDADYVGIMIMPPPDETVTIRVYGLFDSNPLIDNGDENHWSVDHPDILVLAALRSMESFYRNTTGVRDYNEVIEASLIGIDKDTADFSTAGEMEMEG